MIDIDIKKTTIWKIVMWVWFVFFGLFWLGYYSDVFLSNSLNLRSPAQSLGAVIGTGIVIMLTMYLPYRYFFKKRISSQKN